VIYYIVMFILFAIAYSTKTEIAGNIGFTMLLSSPILCHFILWLNNKGKSTKIEYALYSFTLVFLVLYIIIVLRFANWTVG